MTSVVVAGAGLAGLVAARHLAESGVDVTVLERREAVGGRVRSRDVDGFTCDRGFQVLFAAYPAVRRELDVEALDLRTFTPGACIAREDRRSLLSDPLRDPGALVETLFSRQVTAGDKLRTLALGRDVRDGDPEALFDGEDQSIRSFLRNRGFSERALERFFGPFYGGITLDRSLSTSAAVFRYTFRAMSEGAIGVPADGMGAIPRQLAARAEGAGTDVVTGEAIVDLDAATGAENDGGDDSEGVVVATDDRTLHPDAVVVATDPRQARALTGVDAIPTAARGCVTQHLALPREPDLDAGRRIILKAGDDVDREVAPNTVVPMSAVAPEFAPEDRGLLVATFLGDAAFDADDATLRERTRESLDSWYPEHRFAELEVVATDRVEFAQFPQPPGFRDDLPSVDAPDGPVFLAGDYTEWSSIQGSMRSGRRAANAVLDQFD